MNKEIFEQAVRELSKNTGKSLKESKELLKSAVKAFKKDEYKKQ